jgi:arylsulfatase
VGTNQRNYPGFQGTVGRTFAGSEPFWPERVSAAGKPNVVVILVDDLGYSDLGCYGSEIATPNIDRLAAEGVRFTDFHSTPMCSPTRASLLTGVNPHAAGVAAVVHADPGFPGYAMELAHDLATLPEIFRDAGYFTAMVGKWHLSKDSLQNDAAAKASWPCQRGFDRYYGFLDAFTNLHQPHRIVADNHTVAVDQYPDDYYFTDDMTDQAIAMIRSAKASEPTKPFLLYVAHGAVHAPLHAKAADIAAQRGRYDDGWDELRAARFERMRQLGVLDDDVRLAPRNNEPNFDVAAWNELPEDQRRLAARYMEIYAAMITNLDENTGRLLAAIEQLGELDNTIVIFTSDNGASREGEVEGTSSYLVHLMNPSDVDHDLTRIDEMGGPTTMPHYPRGWAMAGNTPFRLYKINTHAGGHTVPFIMRGPIATTDQGGFRRQYQYVTDVLPTLLELCDLEHPADHGAERNGEPLRPIHGASFVPCLTDPSHASTHDEQYVEMLGHRGYRLGDWEAVTLHQPATRFDDSEWELYDMSVDPTQLNNLAAERPDILADLAGRWEEAAWQNLVFPLDEGSQLKYVLRPPWQATFEQPLTIVAGTPTLERWRSLQLLFLRSCTITVRFECTADDEGVLLSHGDQGGGYVIWLDAAGVHVGHNDGRGIIRTLNGPRPEPGVHEVVFDLDAIGGMQWNPTFSLDGAEVDRDERWPCLFAMAPFQGIDVGIDRRSPVVWSMYQQHGPYPYTGQIEWVRYEPGPVPPDGPSNLIPLLREIGLAYE